MTGAGSVVGPTLMKGIHGLAFDSTGVLYGSVATTSTLGTVVTKSLATINPQTGATVVIGAFDPAGTIKDLQGLAHDPTSGVLYGSTGTGFDGTPGDLFAIDKLTGAATLLGSLTVSGASSGVPVALSGLAIDGSGTAYGSYGGTDGRLVVIDPATRTFAYLGDIGSNGVEGLAAPCPGNAIYGSGCPGSDERTPLLFVRGCTEAGQTMDLVVRNAVGGATGLLVVGTQSAATPLVGSCSLLVGGLLPVTVPLSFSGSGGGAGTFATSVALPPVPTETTIMIQVLVADANGAGGVAASNGVRLTIR
jgi:hypothetical protein